MRKKVAILGSTGSIGTQALDVVGQNPDELKVTVLTARNNTDLLIKQAIEYKPSAVVIVNEEKHEEVTDALHPHEIEVYSGEDALNEIVKLDNIDIVLTAMVGFSGLLPTISAIKAHKNIALANKETLVVAGELITRLIVEKNVRLFPVDSEHSAIFQCLVGELSNPPEKIILTASGGPFRETKLDDFNKITVDDALKHPNWSMGAKITVDSATLMNKGLEAIEAKWLFDLEPHQIEIVIHPQSIIHSIVQFEDGSMKAQLGLPDMKLPIQYALGYPKRYKSNFKRLDFLKYNQLTFEKPDLRKFRCLAIASEALRMGGNVPCIMNAANEVAVQAFLNNKLAFAEIPDIIERAIQKMEGLPNPTLYDLIETNEKTRELTNELI